MLKELAGLLGVDKVFYVYLCLKVLDFITGVFSAYLKHEVKSRKMREGLRRDYGMGAYAILTLPKIEEYLKSSNVVIDGLYSWDELKILKEKFEDNFFVISVVVDKSIRYNRLTKRDIRPLTNKEAKSRDISEIEALAKGGPIAYADYFILNNGSMDDYMGDIKKITNEILK